MRMQEPEQRQQFGPDGQTSQESSEYSAGYPGSYESEQQQEYIEVIAGDQYQQQKIHPQQEQRLRGKVLAIIAIVLASIGFFKTLAGIIVSAIVLKYANGQTEMLMGGVIGLVGSIVVMLVCIAVYVIAMIVLTRTSRARRLRRRMGVRM